MPLYINTNTMSLNAQTHLTQNTNNLQSIMEQLSSGFRINRAGDDAAGLELSEGLRSQYNGASQANSNVQDGINMLNIADGAMQTIEDDLQRMRELAVEAANDTFNTAQRNAVNQELNSRANDIDRIASATQYNNQALLDGTFGGGGPVYIQLGPNADSGAPPDLNRLDISGAVASAKISALTAAAAAPGSQITSQLSGGAGIDITDNASAQATISSLDTAINTLNTQRGTLGAYVNQMQSAESNLSQSVENLQAAEARIRDVDVASATSQLTQDQVLQQSAALVLSQANQAPSIALQLLKGQ